MFCLSVKNYDLTHNEQICYPWRKYNVISGQSLLMTDLTHWRWVTHIYVDKLTIVGSDNGLSAGQCQAIMTNDGILLIGPLGTNFSKILIEIQTFSFKKMCLKVSCGKWRPSCFGLNVLTHCGLVMPWGFIELGHHNHVPVVADGTKSELILTNHQWGLVAFTWVQFHRKCSR